MQNRLFFHQHRKDNSLENLVSFSRGHRCLLSSNGQTFLPNRYSSGNDRELCVLMYEHTIIVQKVDEARDCLHNKEGCIPPTSAGLRHLLWAVYQAGFVWGQCLIKQPVSQSLLSGAGNKMESCGSLSGQLFSMHNMCAMNWFDMDGNKVARDAAKFQGESAMLCPLCLWWRLF